MYAAIAALVALPCVLGRSRLNEAVLANRPMRYLGRISYGMFLLHLLVLEAVMHVLGNRTFTGSAGQVFLFTTGGTIAVAALAYRVVEQPAMRLRRLVRPAGAEPGRRHQRERDEAQHLHPGPTGEVIGAAPGPGGQREPGEHEARRGENRRQARPRRAARGAGARRAASTAHRGQRPRQPRRHAARPR